jgi:adenylylsulfate kinase-like enzyme
MIYNLIGQPHSGKSTLAIYLKKALETFYPSRKAFIIDGDFLRKILNNKDYSEKGRRDNVSKAYAIAKYLDSDDSHDVIIAVISPFLDLREEFKFTADVTEIYVHTTNIRGKEKFHVENFEKPETDFIEIDTTDVSEFISVNELLNKIESKKNTDNGIDKE